MSPEREKALVARGVAASIQGAQAQGLKAGGPFGLFAPMPPGGLISRLTLSLTAFEAIVETLPLGSVGYEPALNAKGERLIWVEAAVADRLMAMKNG